MCEGLQLKLWHEMRKNLAVWVAGCRSGLIKVNCHQSLDLDYVLEWAGRSRTISLRMAFEDGGSGSEQTEFSQMSEYYGN